MNYILLTIGAVIAFYTIAKILRGRGNKLHKAFISIGNFHGKSYAEIVEACG